MTAEQQRQVGDVVMGAHAAADQIRTGALTCTDALRAPSTVFSTMSMRLMARLANLEMAIDAGDHLQIDLRL